MLRKLEMRCLKSYPNQLFVACNIFGVRYEKKIKEHLSPRRAGGKCWIKSATSEKCLDIAITAMSWGGIIIGFSTIKRLSTLS